MKLDELTGNQMDLLSAAESEIYHTIYHTYRDQDVLCAIDRAYACGRRDGVGGASCPCPDLHRVMPDSRERIEADAAKWFPEASDLARRCFALMDGDAE